MDSKTFIFMLLLATKICSCNQDAKRLYESLLNPRNYNKLVRPVSKTSDILTIKIGLRLAQLIDVDEKSEIIALNVWLLQEWNDSRLSWDPDEYSNLTAFDVPSESIWKPDIVLYNNADGDYTVTLMTKAKLTYPGTIRWEPPAIYRSQCDMDVEYFPFDQQHCHLKFGAWTYGSALVDLRHMWFDELNMKDEFALIDPAIDLKKYFGNDEWNLMRVAGRKNLVKYPCCKDPYTDITFNITIRRKTLFYTVNLLIPCIAINMLTYLTFYLPADCGEKISLSIFTLLSLSLFQLLLIEIMPPTSIKVPLLGKYILFTTIVVSLSVICTVIVLNVHFRSGRFYEMPMFIRKLFLDILPRILCIKRPYRNTSRSGQTNWPLGHCDLANYDNPYKHKFERLRRGSSEGIRLRTSFIGFDAVDDNMSYICDVCAARQLKLPVNAEKAIEGVFFIARHIQDDSKDKKIKEDWKYMALVVDRLLLWIYTTGCIVGTFGILLNAPVLYDDKSPLSYKLTEEKMEDIF